MLSTMMQMNAVNENFYQKEIAEAQDEIDLEIEEQQVTEVLETTPFNEVSETLNNGDNKMHLEKVQQDKQNDLDKSFVEEDLVDDLENEEEILSSKSEKRTRETNDTIDNSVQDQKRLKVDEDEIDIDEETEENNKVSNTNTQEIPQQPTADEEIEITEDANAGKVSLITTQQQPNGNIADSMNRNRLLSGQNWSSVICELAHTLITLGKLNLSDIYHLMLTCKNLRDFFNSDSLPWRSVALHSFTFKIPQQQFDSKFALFVDSWKEYCKMRKSYSLNIRDCIRQILDADSNDDLLLERMNSKITILNNIRTMSNRFNAKIQDSLNSENDVELLFLVNNTYFSFSLEEEKGERVEREVIYVVGPSGDRIKVVKDNKEMTRTTNVKELKGMRFTKQQYIDYINFYCLGSNNNNSEKSIYDIFTPLSVIDSTTAITTPMIDIDTNTNEQVDIESEEEEDVDIL